MSWFISNPISAAKSDTPQRWRRAAADGPTQPPTGTSGEPENPCALNTVVHPCPDGVVVAILRRRGVDQRGCSGGVVGIRHGNERDGRRDGGELRQRRAHRWRDRVERQCVPIHIMRVDRDLARLRRGSNLVCVSGMTDRSCSDQKCTNREYHCCRMQETWHRAA